MHEQLRNLVNLQDLDSMIRDAEDDGRRSKYEDLGFPMENFKRLYTAREQVAALVEPRFLRIYERLRAKYEGRSVVPVLDKTCLGCFQNIPPSFFSEVTANTPVKVCENCGRILYLLDA